MIMNIKETVNNFINKKFHDRVIAVEPPRGVYYSNGDNEKYLDSYVVTMVYKYRGRVDRFFEFDDDPPVPASVAATLKGAEEFYKHELQKIKLHNENTK